jgi:hypothetical protein
MITTLTPITKPTAMKKAKTKDAIRKSFHKAAVKRSKIAMVAIRKEQALKPPNLQIISLLDGLYKEGYKF